MAELRAGCRTANNHCEKRREKGTTVSLNSAMSLADIREVTEPPGRAERTGGTVLERRDPSGGSRDMRSSGTFSSMRFFRRCSILLAVSLFVSLWARSAVCAQVPRVSPLAGITKLTVIVETLPPVAALANVTEERLRTVAELKLRVAGLRVVSHDEDKADPEIVPYVYVQLTMASNPAGLFIYNVNLSLRREFSSPINGAWITGVLWEGGGVGSASSSRMPNDVTDHLGEFLDTLVNEILKAHPRR